MFYHLTPIVRALLIANVCIFFLQDFSEDGLTATFALWPTYTPLFHVWQLISYAFLHSSFSHLFFNMFGLFMFGPEIERTLGTRHFLIYYFACVLGAALLHLVVTSLQGAIPVPTVGASGGIFGILLAFAMFFPQRKLMLLFPPIPMPAWLFVTLYGAAELLMGVFGTMQGVAHFAHLGGMLAGFLLLLYWRTFSHSNP